MLQRGGWNRSTPGFMHIETLKEKINTLIYIYIYINIWIRMELLGFAMDSYEFVGTCYGFVWICIWFCVDRVWIGWDSITLWI
jgi:hypothetical protein